MSFNEFEITVRKAFGSLINPGHHNVWMDPNRRDGMRYCAKTKTGMFITGNALSRTISVYKTPNDLYPTVIPV